MADRGEVQAATVDGCILFSDKESNAFESRPNM